MSGTVRSIAAVAALVVAAFMSSTAYGVYNTITLTNPGFEEEVGGDYTYGWFGNDWTSSHASHPVTNHTSEDLGAKFAGYWGTAVGSGGHQTVSENFAANTLYHFTGLTGKYDGPTSSYFEIGYVTTPGDATTFVPLASQFQPCTGHTLGDGTPDLGWNLRQGVYYTTASGPEIGTAITVRWTGTDAGGAAWVDNFRLRKGSPKTYIKGTDFDHITLVGGETDGINYAAARGQSYPLGHTGTATEKNSYGDERFAIRDDGVGDKRLEISNYGGALTTYWADVSTYDDKRFSVQIEISPGNYLDGAHGAGGYCDQFRFVHELADNNRVTIATVDAYDSYDGPDGSPSSTQSNGWPAGGDIDGYGEDGGIDLTEGVVYTFYYEIPDDVELARLTIAGGNLYSSSSKVFYINNVKFDGVATNPLWGDANEDGMCDTQDFTILKDKLGQGTAENPAIWCEGDFNHDDVVDTQDFTILKDNLGVGGTAGSQVPEPATMLLLIAAAPALLGLKRKRS
ncbi:MAG: PEP-CTERM sorting domain-containing protein [Planctomycetota bacterium]|jgi:hypothetical protein